jgi:hypothetical protein
MKRPVASQERNAEYLVERLFLQLEKQGDLYSLAERQAGLPRNKISPSLRLRKCLSYGKCRVLTAASQSARNM